jgi:hypothetical protein
LRRRDANAFLCEITHNRISLKDFRTLSACSHALEHLTRLNPSQASRENAHKLNRRSEKWPNSLRTHRQYASAAMFTQWSSTLLRLVD